MEYEDYVQNDDDEADDDRRVSANRASPRRAAAGAAAIRHSRHRLQRHDARFRPYRRRGRGVDGEAEEDNEDQEDDDDGEGVINAPACHIDGRMMLSAEELDRDAESQVAMEPVSLSDPVVLDPGYDEAADDWCFLCDMAADNPYTGEANPYYEDLICIIDDSYGHCTMNVLTKKVQRFYNEHLRQHTTGKHVWSREVIKKHIEDHAPTPKTMLNDTVRVVNHLMNILVDHGICYRDPTTDVKKVNDSNVRLYLQLSGHRSKTLHSLHVLQSGSDRKQN